MDPSTSDIGMVDLGGNEENNILVKDRSNDFVIW
jgi:hypothetical protein